MSEDNGIVFREACSVLTSSTSSPSFLPEETSASVRGVSVSRVPWAQNVRKMPEDGNLSKTAGSPAENRRQNLHVELVSFSKDTFHFLESVCGKWTGLWSRKISFHRWEAPRISLHYIVFIGLRVVIGKLLPNSNIHKRVIKWSTTTTTDWLITLHLHYPTCYRNIRHCLCKFDLFNYNPNSYWFILWIPPHYYDNLVCVHWNCESHHIISFVRHINH